ncbi:oxidoreductase [Paenibacillus baekrokdamisoli]|uniref:Oxidoreductase n=1 Tax=Paenibacillus baekrokdamisoli TaxID=1712516 RepID=A0A3G9JPE8_9BACL|nr:Gfo/Idh/MocA family oxidoreductase [Paenibacillus baekrokdamisoli]MBB3072140.1 putative dehydrogenase [Paenibacillus baekrokdamisoli]BBH24724.1 oxidoreductase [Paenibacillus baekrokdamisoli]
MSIVRVGMIGYKFMGKAHSNAYRALPMFFPAVWKPEMKAICGRDAGGVEQARVQFGWESAETDWRDMVTRDDIDVVDINAPSDAHKEIAIAAAAAGKHIFCEKPLALNLADSIEMLNAAEEAGVKHMVGFNYRFSPAVQLAKKLISEGRIGTIYHFRGLFLQDWIVDPTFPLVWRLQKEIAGSGSHGDLGAHVIDMARFLVGEFQEVIGMSETFVKERPIPSAMTGLSAKGDKDAPLGAVTVDDATVFLARFAGGALGSIEATRFAPGHRCTNSFEINGSKGSIKFDFERLNELEVYFTEDAVDVQGFRRVLATDSTHAYMDAWWPAGHTIGYEHTFTHEMREFMLAIEEDRQPVPNFVDGVECQAVLEAVDKSIEERRWVAISELR